MTLPQQQWFYTQPGDDHLAILGGDQCMDLRDGNKAEGATVQTWACGSNRNQASVSSRRVREVLSKRLADPPWPFMHSDGFQVWTL